MQNPAPTQASSAASTWQQRLVGMLRRYQHWFVPSTDGMDASQEQLTNLLNINTIATLVLYAVLIIELAIQGEFSATIMWSHGLGWLVYFACWRLLFRGYFTLAGIAIMITISITLAVVIWMLGSILVPGVNMFLYIIPLAGLLFRRKGLVAATLLGSLMMLGLTAAQVYGLMPAANAAPRIGFWVNMTTMMVGTAFLINAGLVSIDRILRSLALELEERQKAEDQLRELNTQLQEMIKERKDALRQTNANLHKALATRDTFMNAITKELLVPLGSIRQLAQQMQEPGLETSNPRQKAAIATLEHSGQRLASGVNQVLEYTQLQRGEAVPNLADVEVGTLCKGMVAAYTSPAALAGLRLESDLPAGMLLARCDEARLRQVLDCLLANAVKFGAGGGSIGLSAALQGSQVRVSVWDHGIGIRAEELPLLFQPFAQLDAGLARRFTGFGLDLAIAKLNTERMGGELTVSSQPGAGTTFSVTLPAAGGA